MINEAGTSLFTASETFGIILMIRNAVFVESLKFKSFCGECLNFSFRVSVYAENMVASYSACGFDFENLT